MNSPGQKTVVRCRGERGNAVIEFALVSLLYVPLLLGVVALGLNLGRSVQVAQVARDAASMYVRGIDFSQSGNQNILVQLAQPLGMTVNGGTGVVILSKITYLNNAICSGIPNCNVNQQVLVQRIVVGNSGLRSSNFAAAGAVTLDAQGNVFNYMTDSHAVVSGLSGKLTLNGNEFAYVAETYFPSADISTFTNGTGVYSVSIF